MRAMISNGLLRGARHKLWCIGPMFRHEKPQKGRYRQFYQVDVEAVGFPGPGRRCRADRADRAPVAQAGLTRVRLQINSLGTAEARAVYREQLVAVFSRAPERPRRGQPPAPARQSAAHPGQQESGPARADRGGAAADRLPGPGVAGALRGAARRAGCDGH